MTKPFAHLTDPDERARARVTLIIFPCVLLICFASVSGLTQHNLEELEQRLRAVNSELTDDLSYRQRVDNTNRYGIRDPLLIEQAARRIFRDIHNDEPRAGDEHQLSDIRDDFLRPLFNGSSSTDARDRSRLIAFARAMARNDFPLLRNSVPVRFWFILGFSYWACILLLYAFLMTPAKGEPAFNIIDVGLIGVFVQYSGAFNSFFIVVFVFSLALAAWDFAAQELLLRKQINSRVANVTAFLARVALILGPYILALLTSIFWAISDGVLINSEPLRPYLVRWGYIVVVMVPTWTIFYSISHYMLHKKQPTAEV